MKWIMLKMYITSNKHTHSDHKDENIKPNVILELFVKTLWFKFKNICNISEIWLEIFSKIH